MANARVSLLHDLSTADLKRLLAARERIDVLEKEKARLVKELAVIDSELDKLIAGASEKRQATGVSRKVGRKKTRKKTVRKKVAAKTTVKAAAPKKATRKKTGRRPAAAKKKAVKRTSKVDIGSGAKLEDVIAAVIKSNGGPMAFKDLFAAIVKGKLYRTRSSNFDNVLRRTLSTSTAVKRVGRGVYGLA